MQGERMKMVYALPANEKLWQRYAQLRTDRQRNDRGVGEAIDFYRANQADTDAGAVVAWPQRHDPDAIVGHSARDESQAQPGGTPRSGPNSRISRCARL